jgi:predicted Fe-Mo cluster-binding NifX family protein
MKKIAIPELGERIAPRLGMARELVIAVIKDGEVEQRTNLDLSCYPPLLKIKRLREEGVNTLICAGIERVFWGYLTGFGIQVIAGVTGPVDKAIDRYLSGNLIPGPVPGFGPRVRGRHGRRRHWY